MENFKFNEFGYLITKNSELMHLGTTPQQMYNFLLKIRKLNNKELTNEYIEMFRSHAPFMDDEEEFLNTLKKNSGI